MFSRKNPSRQLGAYKNQIETDERVSIFQHVFFLLKINVHEFVQFHCAQQYSIDICYLLHFKKKQEAAVYIQNLIAKFDTYTYAEANTPLSDQMYACHYIV